MSLEQILKDLDVNKTVAMDVAVAIDCSGSMQEEFETGIVVNILQRLQTFAKFVDDDGKVETVGFNTTSTKVNTLKVDDDINAFVKNNYRAGGGTNYADAISNLLNVLDHNLPSIVFVVTDGENGDTEKTLNVLKEASTKHPTKYVHFIRAGTDALNVKFIEQAADLLSNVGYSNLPDTKVDSDTFFKSLVTNELASFLKSQETQEQAA